MTVLSTRPSQRPSGRPGQAPSALRAPGLDWLLMLATIALVALGTLLVWSATSTRADLTGGDPNAYLRKQLVNVAIGLVLMVAVMATDHRWVRILAPLAYVASVVGLVLVLVAGCTINGSRSWLQLGGMSIQPSEFAKLAVVIGMALVVAERTERRWGRRVGSLEVVGDARHRRDPRRAHPPAARPRHHAGPVRDRVRRPGDRRRRSPVAGRADRRRPWAAP